MSQTMSTQLYEKMKSDIVENRLPVGEPLKQEMLSAKYNVSRIPVRDTIQKLKSEGWLTTSGKCGVMIPPFSATEAEDLYLMRSYLEPLILDYAFELMTHSCLGEAHDLLLTIDQNQGMSIEEHGQLNWQFHACLYKQANRPTLYATIEPLHTQCGRYIGYHNEKLHYTQTSQKEHYDLLDALRNQDKQSANRLLKAHISDAGKILVNILRNKTKD